MPIYSFMVSVFHVLFKNLYQGHKIFFYKKISSRNFIVCLLHLGSRSIWNWILCTVEGRNQGLFSSTMWISQVNKHYLLKNPSIPHSTAVGLSSYSGVCLHMSLVLDSLFSSIGPFIFVFEFYTVIISLDIFYCKSSSYFLICQDCPG